jgi:nicotinamidase-related amidase
MWQRYYSHWREMTRDRLDPAMIELLPPLAALAPPAHIIDKATYSAFSGSGLPRWLHERNADGIIVTGAETDVCILASILGAVDLGYRVIIATDAICSSWDDGHDALLGLYHQRFSDQIETAKSETILAEWPAHPLIRP